MLSFGILGPFLGLRQLTEALWDRIVTELAVGLLLLPLMFLFIRKAACRHAFPRISVSAPAMLPPYPRVDFFAIESVVSANFELWNSPALMSRYSGIY